MHSHRPKNDAKLKKFQEDRAAFRTEALGAIDALDEKDLVGMFGMLAGELVSRRRESELDILRCERFHHDSDNLARHKEQMNAYTRRLRACSAFIRLLNLYSGPSLLETLKEWADETTEEISF